MRAGRRQGATTILNPAPADACPPELLGLCDVVVPNEHEVAVLGGEAAVRAAGATTLVVTRGAAGVDLVTAAGSTSVPSFSVDAVDTTGAGDAFCGALAARLAAGVDLAAALEYAAAAGALATTRPGSRALVRPPRRDRRARRHRPDDHLTPASLALEGLVPVAAGTRVFGAGRGHTETLRARCRQGRRYGVDQQRSASEASPSSST